MSDTATMGDAPVTDTAAPTDAPEPNAAGAEAEPKATPAPEPKPEPRRYKLKVRGAEQEFDEEEVVRAAQRYKAGEDPLREAAEARKQVEAAKAKIRSKDLDTRIEGWRDLGYSDEEIAEFATGVVLRQIEREKADPRDLKIQELEAQQRKVEAERQTAAEKEHEAQVEAQVAAARDHFNKAIVPALKGVDLPVTENTVGLVAGILKNLAEGHAAAGVEANLDDLLADAADMAKTELTGYVKTTLGKLEGADLVKILGPEAVEKVRAHLVSQWRTKRDGGGTAPAPRRPAPAPRAPLSQDEWRARMLGE